MIKFQVLSFKPKTRISFGIWDIGFIREMGGVEIVENVESVKTLDFHGTPTLVAYGAGIGG